MTWYNENDLKAAAWLRELGSRGLIPQGEIDERSIEEVEPNTCGETAHFFAGIGGWPYALKLAGWPEDRPVWTGSCPCQPFSVAGKRQGAKDVRHLWPAWFRLIRKCRPNTIFGEQVAGAIGHGWLDGVFADLEGEGYTCGAVVLGAHSVGAPHIRQRLYWVACTDGQSGTNGGLGDSDAAGLQGRLVGGNSADQQRAGSSGVEFWYSYDLITCADGKSRRIESGTFPLAHGVPARVGRLRGYGNAIVPQVAAAFVRAFLELEA